MRIEISKLGYNEPDLVWSILTDYGNELEFEWFPAYPCEEQVLLSRPDLWNKEKVVYMIWDLIEHGFGVRFVK